MSIEHDIAAATNQRDALIIIGRALDRLEAKLDADDRWETWDSGPRLTMSEMAEVQREVNAATAQRIEAKHVLAIHEQIAAVKEQLQTAAGEDADALQAKLRLLRDEAGEKVYNSESAGGGDVGNHVPEGVQPTVSSDGDTGDVELLPPTPEREVERRRWAHQVNLEDFIPLGRIEASEAFAKGGPMWLILGNRDAVMQMPFEYRQWLVQDIEKDSPRLAQEIGRDILKSTQSADKQITLDAVDALSSSRG